MNERTTQAIVPIQITNQTLGSIIGGRKSAVTRSCRKKGHNHFARQGRYHDHIIRDQKGYEHIKHYIQTNPEKWKEDKFNE